MRYNLRLIKKQHQKTCQWSGGTTTELAIYPRESSYSDRNFKWRLSSAKVEDEESTFTHLKGVWRWIMILDGKVKLFHENHGEKELNPYEPYSFSGEWVTKSVGKARDFNLMLAEGLAGTMEHISIQRGTSKEMDMNKEKITKKELEKVTYALYCAEGEILVRTFHDEIKINEGELLLINCQIVTEEEDHSPNLYIDVYNEGECEANVVSTMIYEK